MECMGGQLRNEEITTGFNPLESQCAESIETTDSRTSSWRLRNGAVEGLRNKISITMANRNIHCDKDGYCNVNNVDIPGVDHNGQAEGRKNQSQTNR
jgi:hypothetical protein